MGKFYRINQYIQAKEVFVVDEKGNSLGKMPIFNAIQKARELGTDLVEVAPNANPPVCKLIDFKKFKYQEAKKERGEKKGQKGGELKEIVFSPFIGQNDLNIRIKKIKDFLIDGNKVKIRVKFTGRQLGKREFGDRLIEQVLKEVEEISQKEGDPKFQGRELYLIISPKKGILAKEKENDQKNEN